jgi:hypothetical protein
VLKVIESSLSQGQTLLTPTNDNQSFVFFFKPHPRVDYIFIEWKNFFDILKFSRECLSDRIVTLGCSGENHLGVVDDDFTDQT